MGIETSLVGYLYRMGLLPGSGVSDYYISTMHVVVPNGENIGVTELPLRIKSIAHGQVLGLKKEELTGEVFPVSY